jgi:hypothetical protein
LGLLGLTLSGSADFVGNSVGVAQRSPTAINLNPFGINTGKRQTDRVLETCLVMR